MSKHSHNAFTLIELLVVLAIIAIISSISFGAFKSISEGNKRTSCQSNLAQVFKSVRLYSQDYDGRLPYLNEDGDPNMATYANVNETPRGGIGLWSLYTFGKKADQVPVPLPANGNTNCGVVNGIVNVDLPAQFEDPTSNMQNAVGLTGYVRSAKIFHCPADNFKREVQVRDLNDNTSPTLGCKTLTTNSPTLLIPDGNFIYLNPSYLSYQVKDDHPLQPVTNPVDLTYSSFRQPERVDNEPKTLVRQIRPYKVESGVTQKVERATRDMTILTWCRFHRSLDNDTGATRSTKRAFDNVLFSDGSVQSLPAEQEVQNKQGVPPVDPPPACSGWQRVPREKANTMLDAANCIPSP